VKYLFFIFGTLPKACYKGFSMVEENGLAAKRRKRRITTNPFAHLAHFRGNFLLTMCESLPLTIQ